MDRSSNVDRDFWRLAYKDPHVFGSWWRMALAHEDMSDGSDDSILIARPFYSLDSRWSFSVAASDRTATQSQYALGRIVDQFSMRDQSFEVAGGISQGLHDGWAHRLLAGFRHVNREFAPLRGSDTIPEWLPSESRAQLSLGRRGVDRGSIS